MPRHVVVRAGLDGASPAENEARRQYRRRAFTIIEVAKDAGVSASTARRVILNDLSAGVLIEISNVRSRVRRFRLRRVDE